MFFSLFFVLFCFSSIFSLVELKRYCYYSVENSDILFRCVWEWKVNGLQQGKCLKHDITLRNCVMI